MSRMRHWDETPSGSFAASAMSSAVRPDAERRDKSDAFARRAITGNQESLSDAKAASIARINGVIADEASNSSGSHADRRAAAEGACPWAAAMSKAFSPAPLRAVASLWGRRA